MPYTEQNRGAYLPRIPAPGKKRSLKSPQSNRVKKKKVGGDRGEKEIHTRLIIRQKLKQQLLYSPDLSEKEKFIEYSVIRVPVQ